MKLTLTNKTAAGIVPAVSSKSVLHRALICAGLCREETHIFCTAPGADVLATVGCLRALGAQITQTKDGFTVRGGLCAETAGLSCGESGSTLRFLLPVAAALGCRAEFLCGERLRQRPMAPLLSALETHGCRISRTETGFCLEGALLPGRYVIDGSLSSQWSSGLLFALPLLSGDSELQIIGKRSSASYIDLTAQVQGQFSVCNEFSERIFVRGGQLYHSCGTFSVEGDWSNAAPFLCAGAFSAEGVSVRGLSLRSLQADRGILAFLQAFGAIVDTKGDTVTVRRGSCQPFSADASQTPDLVPLLALLGVAAAGTTVITGAARLREKESDRLQATAEVLCALGGDVTVTEDGLTVRGTGSLRGGTVSAANDHRIGMLTAVASLLCREPLTVEGTECVMKSYPGFFEDFYRICR